MTREQISNKLIELNNGNLKIEVYLEELSLFLNENGVSENDTQRIIEDLNSYPEFKGGEL
jgi:hypothetical protein